jgi:hypothetical protein
MGEKLRVIIWQTLFNQGLGGFFQPFQIKRIELAKAIAERKNLLILAQTEKDISLVKDGQIRINEKGQIEQIKQEIPNGATFGQIVEIAHNEKEIDRKINLLNILNIADTIAAEKDDQEINENIDYDWFERWRTYAEEIHNEDLRILWAKVLCSEACNSSISLRTLELLKNISKEEAQKIEKIALLNIGGMIIKIFGNPFLELNDDFNGLIPPEYKLSLFVEMEELGIISCVNELGFSARLVNQVTGNNLLFNLSCGNKKLVIRKNGSIEGLDVNGYKITEVGKQIIKILDSDVCKEYLDNIITFLKTKEYDVELI